MKTSTVFAENVMIPPKVFPGGVALTCQSWCPCKLTSGRNCQPVVAVNALNGSVWLAVPRWPARVCGWPGAGWGKQRVPVARLLTVPVTCPPVVLSVSITGGFLVDEVVVLVLVEMPDTTSVVTVSNLTSLNLAVRPTASVKALAASLGLVSPLPRGEDVDDAQPDAPIRKAIPTAKTPILAAA